MRRLWLSAVLLFAGIAHAAAPRVRVSLGPVAPGLTASPLVAAPLAPPVPAAPVARVMNESVPHWIDFRIPPGVRAVSLDGTDVLMLPIDRGALVPVVIVGSSAP